MPEIVRSIIGRFCELVGSHNHAPRHTLRLPVRISLQDSNVKRARARGAATLCGHTRNISDTGLSLVVPSVHFGNRYLMDGDICLTIQLELPDGAATFQVAPVRYEMLDENQVEWGYLVGMRIIKIADAERKRLTQYLREVNKRKAATATATAEAGFAQNAPSL
ncbi:MAG TPA: PilZ domain-containing protein [Pyrinomonadaceae bacterium]|jgi:hypothetical protein|nr:PilZ domain-containing protein [Pyrinomonadaceae bacterium]